MALIIVNEMWRSVDGFLNYQISNTGNVRNANTGRILKTHEHRDGYVIVDLRADDKRTSCKIHRLVAKAFIVNPDNKAQVDHIDNDRQNNYVNNLRWATAQENRRNRRKALIPTTSKYIGVHWNKQHQKWCAQIRINKKCIHIGYFINPKDAARAYNKRVVGLATEYGVLNEISDNEELI